MHPSVPGRYPGDGALAPPEQPGAAGPADLTALFLLRHAELVRLAMLLVGDLATAEDVVQDVFTRLHARREKGISGPDLLPYLKASATAGPAWSGTSHVRFGPCVAGQLASVASGSATWGPGAGH